MKYISYVARGAVAVLLTLSIALPLPAIGASSLGTARGLKAVKLSIDGGKTWLPLGSRSLPVLEGTELRTTSGSAAISLTDGSQLNILPFTALTVRDTGPRTEISLTHGRVTFRLPASTEVEIVTPTARLEPVPGQPMAGEVFVTGAGVMGLKMTGGQLQVRELADERRVMLASLEPVFIPRKPAMSGSFFTTDAPSPVPAGARAAFNPAGESIGYLGPDRLLVIYPGFTNDLTRPFSPKLVRLATNSIPQEHRTDDAMPVFDVGGGYAGYLSGSTFYAQAVAQAQQPPPPGAVPTGLSVGAKAGITLGALGAIGLGVAAGTGAFSGGGGGGSDPCPASPNTPGSC